MACLFFLSLCFSPSVGGVQVRNSTIELFGRFRRRYKQHKVLAKQSLASGGRPGSSGGVDRNCFKNINRKTTDYLGSHSVCFFFFCFSIKKEGEISPNPTSGTIVAFEAKVVLLASDGDEERAWRRGRGSRGRGRRASCWPGGLCKGRS